MPARPKLIGDKDRLVPPAMRAKVLTYLQALPADAVQRHALLVVRLASQAGLRVFGVGGKMRTADHVDEQPIPDDLATFLRAHIAGAPPDAYVVGRRRVPF